jgi:hypothetical protein
LFTSSIDCVYMLFVLSCFVFDHAKYWLCIYVAHLELFCVCSRQVLIDTGNTYTQSILGVNKHKITQDGQHIYTINTRREQAQNNSRRATHIHNQYFVHAKYWLCIYVARLELCCVFSRLVLIVYMRCPSWVILCLFTPSIDCVYVLPILSYFVFVHA